MALIPATKATLGGKRLKPLSSFAFLARQPFCEILAGEFASAANFFPIVFVQRDGAFQPMVLLGLKDGENLFVEANGGWGAGYLPLLYRRYPFTVAPIGENGAFILAIDDTCELLSDTEGEPLFGTDEKSELESPASRAIQLTAEIQGQVNATRELVKQLAAAGLIQPLTAGNAGGDTRNVLFAINEQALKELPDDTFLALRRSGALALAYAHLLSLGQMGALQARQAARQRAQ